MSKDRNHNIACSQSTEHNLGVIHTLYTENKEKKSDRYG